MADKAGSVELDVLPGLSGFGARLQQELRKVPTKGAGLTALETNISKPLDGLRGKIGALGGLLGGAAVVAGFRKVIGETVEWGGEIKKLVRQTGLASESASGLALEAKHFGLDVDTLSRGLGIFDKHVVANDNSFQKLGISVRDAHGQLLPFDQILGKTAAVFQNLPDGPEKTALALNLFGRNGKALLPFLSAGPEAMKHFSEEAKKLGLSLSGEDVRSITRFQFATRELGSSLKGLEVQIGLRVLPVLTKFAQFGATAFQWVQHIPPQFFAAGAALGAFVLAVNLTSRLVTATRNAFSSFGGGLRALRGDSEAAAAGLRAQAAAEVLAADAGRVLAVADAEVVSAEQIMGANTLRSVSGLRAQAVASSAAKYESAGFLATLRGLSPELLGAGLALGVATTALVLQGRAAKEAAKESQVWAQAFLNAVGSTPDAAKQIRSEIAKLEVQLRSVASLTGSRNWLDAVEFWKPSEKDKIRGRIKELQQALKGLGLQAEATAEAGGTAVQKLTGTFAQTAQFNSNLKGLVSEGLPLQLAEQLRTMGQDGQDAAAELASGSRADLSQFVSDWRNSLQDVASAGKVFAGLTLDDFNKWADGLNSTFNFVEQGLSSLAQSVSADTLNAAVDSARSTLDSASSSVSGLRQQLSDLQSRVSSASAAKPLTLAQQQQEARLKQNLADLEARLHQKKTLTLADIQSERRAKQALADFEARVAQRGHASLSDLQEEQRLRNEIAQAEGKQAEARRALTKAQEDAAHPERLILKNFEDQLHAQETYRNSFQALIQRHLPQDFLKDLADLGEQGTGIVNALAGANKTQFNKIVGDWKRAGGEAPSIQEMIRRAFLHNTPIKIQVKPVLDRTLLRQSARAAKQDLLDQLGSVPAELTTTAKFLANTVELTAQTVRFESGITGHAAGGPMVPYKPYRVDEAGREPIVYSTRPGYVVTHAEALMAARQAAAPIGDSGGSRAPSSAQGGMILNGDIIVQNGKPESTEQSVTRALKTMQLLLSH